ncbi:hypothetical protein ACQPZP_37430 [Spirillospora sp. CA-142024]|uniref:hypothetical protein n=1 Tax=Spirillospora sp. CA-142024 TaxID=3240036 RepID=UPI003D8B4E79
MPPGPLRDLKELLYRLYVEAGYPSLDEIHASVEREGTERVTGWPGRDSIRRIIGEAAVPPSQADTVTVAAVLARLARWDAQDAAARARELWVQAQMTAPVGPPRAAGKDLSDEEIFLAPDPGQLAADGRLLELLAAGGFSGEPYRLLALELARYGVALAMAWGTEPGSVAQALCSFRRELVGGRWRPAERTIKEAFAGACLPLRDERELIRQAVKGKINDVSRGARRLAAGGYDVEEIAEVLGISTSAVEAVLEGSPPDG